MPERWTWRVAELPYEYAVEIRGEQVVWIWDSGPGIPPTEEAQPLRALLQQGRAAVPSAWQQVPPPILEQVRARGAQLLGGAGADGVEATGPTQFAPAIAAQTAMSSPAPGAAPGQASSNPQGSAGANPQGNAAPPGWGPPTGSAAPQQAPPGWGPPQGAAPQAGFGPPQGPPAAAPGGPASGAPSSAAPTTPSGTGAAGALPTSASLPTAAPVAPAPAGDPKAQVLALLRAGEKARAIDLYRQHFKVSAMLAKEEVEYLAQTLKDE